MTLKPLPPKLSKLELSRCITFAGKTLQFFPHTYNMVDGSIGSVFLLKDVVSNILLNGGLTHAQLLQAMTDGYNQLPSFISGTEIGRVLAIDIRTAGRSGWPNIQIRPRGDRRYPYRMVITQLKPIADATGRSPDELYDSLNKCDLQLVTVSRAVELTGKDSKTIYAEIEAGTLPAISLRATTIPHYRILLP